MKVIVKRILRATHLYDLAGRMYRRLVDSRTSNSDSARPGFLEARTKHLGIMQEIYLYQRNAEATLRYLPIASKLRSLSGFEHKKLLEVGSGSQGIAEYLRKEVVGVDTNFQEPISKYLRPVIVTDVSLPFPDNSFDYVISVDMLEHVNRNDRPVAISEFVRVAREGLILAVPEGEPAEKQDEDLNTLYERVRGERHPFLEEHVRLKLPRQEDLLDAIRTAQQRHNKEGEITVEKNLNLKYRHLLLSSWIKSDNPFWKVVQRSTVLMLPIRGILNFGVPYRKTFYVAFASQQLQEVQTPLASIRSIC